MERSIFEEAGFIAVFIIACAFIYTALGDRVLYNFLWLVILGQIILNWQLFERHLKGV